MYNAIQHILLLFLVLQLFACEFVVHQAPISECQFEHAALAPKLILSDGIKAESHFISVLVYSLGIKLAVLQKDLIDDEVSVLRMLIFSAVALPL